MASPTIEQIVSQIRTAIFGKDVRENIALGIEKCYEDVSINNVTKSDIANNLTTTSSGQVLDARQGKVLSDTLNTYYLHKDRDVIDNLNSTSTSKALSANQGRILKDLVPTWGDFSNLYPSITWTDGVYQTTSGTTVSHTLFAVSNFINIHSYEKLVVSAYVVDAAAVCLFDRNQNVIAAWTNPDNTVTPYVTTIDLTQYPKAHYIRLCSLIANKNRTFFIDDTSLQNTLHIYRYTNYSSMPVSWRDCDTLPLNSAIGYYFGWDGTITPTMAHFPTTPFNGEIITISNNYDEHSEGTTWGFQLAVYTASAGAKSLWYRVRYQNWGEWEQINQVKSADTLYIGDNLTYAQMPTTYRNCNTLPINSVIGYHYGWTEEITATMQNFPAVPFTGTIMTYNVVKNNETFGVQLAFEEAYDSYRIWYRTRFVNWRSWKQLADTSMVGGTQARGAFRGLKDFVLCGDSLSVSISYKAEASAKEVKSWGKILADMMSSECDVYAQGGITTGGFLSSTLYTQAVADESQFAILYLGTNDANQSVTKETFKSNYQSIINGLLTNHQFVLCVNLPECTSVSTRETYNDGIREICASNNKAFLVDVAKYNSNFAGLKNWGHLSSAGYAAFAEAASWAIDDTIAANDYFDADIDFPELME